MDKLKLRMIGRQDHEGNEYYVTTTSVPCLVDLSKTVIHVFPDEDEDKNEFWAELVIRTYDPNHSSKNRDAPGRRRRRRANGTPTTPSGD